MATAPKVVRRLIVKRGVRFDEFTGQMLTMLDGIYAAMFVVPECPDPLVITSAADGMHVEGSKHYASRALDIRSKNFPTSKAKRAFMAQLKLYLPKQGKVLLENEGEANEHFHVQA